MFAFLLWCVLFVMCWPLALLALVAYPFIWLLLLPFRIVGVAVHGVLEIIFLAITLPFRLLGAHTDSPNLRIKPVPDTGRAGLRQLGVEVYGGPLLNSWLDRDLGLAGRVAVRTPAGPQLRLLRVHRPLLRIPQLAPHLDRAIRTDGLKLDAQLHVVPFWSAGPPEPGAFASFLAAELEVGASDILGYDVMTYDLTGGVLAGLHEEFVSSARQDDLTCSHACVTALASVAAEPASQERLADIVPGRRKSQAGRGRCGAEAGQRRADRGGRQGRRDRPCLGAGRHGL